MTNEQIIINESMELMKQGIIGTSGRKLQFEDAEGNTKEIDEPETIHTYSGWKSLGFQVQKGEKAVAKFSIWKFVNKKDEEDEDKMFLTSASWFKASQVAPIESEA